MVDWLGLDYANELGAPGGDPLYRRIVFLVRRLIGEGRLAEGDLLPAERDFARMAGISRGTVSLAYDELKREGIITAAPGRGSMVASDRNVSTASRKEQAIRVLSNALERLEALGFSAWEIEAFLHLLLRGREGEVRVRALLVDCNPEALELLGHQLGTISHLELSPQLLEDFQRLDAEELAAFDLVLTTESHRTQVLANLSRLRVPPERFLSVAVSPSRETLVDLARIPGDVEVQVCTRSRRFGEIIQRHLAGLGHGRVRVVEAPELGSDSGGAEESVRLVVPSTPAGRREPSGSVIRFDYQVDRGSILRVEEAVTALLLQKGEGISTGR